MKACIGSFPVRRELRERESRSFRVEELYLGDRRDRKGSDRGRPRTRDATATAPNQRDLGGIPGSDGQEVSLRDPLRAGVDDLGLKEIIGAAVKKKKAAHAGMLDLAKTANRPMIHIDTLKN
ncbi:hypothetical protein IEQ34_021552 [Dendrobium chrysotoxum]|uniref:Uncharacterized protein n=1 Tax=Dendrobium chrysotoxum TaxID=161865 RepID=A0AAV7G501_DENCH|nr:hypothetical protein IEQ34_021552 [Dendrobium chrysotoxum]